MTRISLKYWYKVMLHALVSSCSVKTRFLIVRIYYQVFDQRLSGSCIYKWYHRAYMYHILYICIIYIMSKQVSEVKVGLYLPVIFKPDDM